MNLPPDGAACQRRSCDKVGKTVPGWWNGAGEAQAHIDLNGPDGGHTAID